MAIAAIAMIGTISAQGIRCSEQVALEDLATYMDSTRNIEPHVKLFYSNLVNNPTHSYRIEHLDLGFNGCTGRVDEHVVMADGTRRNNVFGEPEEAVNYMKLRNLRAAINHYVKYKRLNNEIRFDVISITGTPEAGNPQINHFEDIPMY